MDVYMAVRNRVTSRTLPLLLDRVAQDLAIANLIAGKDQTTWSQYNNLYNAMNTYYGAGGAGEPDIVWEINWECNTDNV